MAYGRSKGGSSAARAARARKGHAKRKSKLFAAGHAGRSGSHYKGGSRRAKTSWLF